MSNRKKLHGNFFSVKVWNNNGRGNKHFHSPRLHRGSKIDGVIYSYGEEHRRKTLPMYFVVHSSQIYW